MMQNLNAEGFMATCSVCTGPGKLGKVIKSDLRWS